MAQSAAPALLKGILGPGADADGVLETQAKELLGHLKPLMAPPRAAAAAARPRGGFGVAIASGGRSAAAARLTK